MIKNVVNMFKEEIENVDRTKTRGFVNEKAKSSALLKDNGDIILASNGTVQYKASSSTGSATEISYTSNTITNRKTIMTDEIMVNRHKLNPQLWELTDMKEYLNDPTSAIGNLRMSATVLVKTWEPNLERWVLIRRPMTAALFATLASEVKAPEKMNLNDDIGDELKQARDTGKIIL